MTIILTGGTGLIGQSLGQKLAQSNYRIHLLARSQKSTKNLNYPFKFFLWPEDSYEVPLDVFPQDSPFGIIHLAGAPIFCWPWTQQKKASIYNSRVLSARALVKACQNLKNPPQFFISSNALGIYGDQGELQISEDWSFENQNLFLQKVCKDWQEAVEPLKNNCRIVIARTGIVLDQKDGFLKTQIQMSKLFVPFFLSQHSPWLSWIHKEDIVSFLSWAVKNTQAQGVYNATSPNPVTLNTFLKHLAIHLNKKYLRFPVPLFLIKLLGGELFKNLLCSQRVLPQKAQQENFTFKHKTLQDAFKNFTKK